MYTYNKADLAYYLIEILALLEQGNAKEACKTLDSELAELAQENPADFFRLLRDCSVDRPSAWWQYCGYTKAPKELAELELAMHASKEQPVIRRLVKARLADFPSALRIINSRDWDT